jgi:hypothetical protein
MLVAPLSNDLVTVITPSEVSTVFNLAHFASLEDVAEKDTYYYVDKTTFNTVCVAKMKTGGQSRQTALNRWVRTTYCKQHYELHHIIIHSSACDIV